MTSRKLPIGLNPRHAKLPDELKEAILAALPVTYEFYTRFRSIYSSVRLKVIFTCEICGSSHMSNFKHLNKRTIVKDAVCPKCVMKVSSSNEDWRKKNSQIQKVLQSNPDHRAKNAAGVSRFWAENPDKLEVMKQRLKATHQTVETKSRMANRKIWNGRGISGDYLSKWGWLHFDSSYELATIVAFEARSDVQIMRRGPVIDYEFEGVNRQYLMDFEVVFTTRESWWMEVKSGYVGKIIENHDKLRAKLSEAIKLRSKGYVDRVILLSERNAQEILGTKLPRSTDRTALFRSLYSKIKFARKSDEERYKCPD